MNDDMKRLLADTAAVFLIAAIPAGVALAYFFDSAWYMLLSAAAFIVLYAG